MIWAVNVTKLCQKSFVTKQEETDRFCFLLMISHKTEHERSNYLPRLDSSNMCLSCSFSTKASILSNLCLLTRPASDIMSEKINTTQWEYKYLTTELN